MLTRTHGHKTMCVCMYIFIYIQYVCLYSILVCGYVYTHVRTYKRECTCACTCLEMPQNRNLIHKSYQNSGLSPHAPAYPTPDLTRRRRSSSYSSQPCGIIRSRPNTSFWRYLAINHDEIFALWFERRGWGGSVGKGRGR